MIRLLTIAIIPLLASAFFNESQGMTFKIIYTFQGGSDGIGPDTPLVNLAGTLYGTTSGGGGSTGCQGGCGTIFSLTPSGEETVLYRFKNGIDGRNPQSLQFVGNAFVGLSIKESHHGQVNILFSISPSGTFTRIKALPQPVWLQYGNLTQVGNVYYGVNSGINSAYFHGCSTGQCGYIYSLTP
jgi:uncharacterized repeat protein (TIGR03803 family)